MNERALKLMPGDADEATEKLSEHYIEAQTSLVERACALKEGDAFAVLDSHGMPKTIPDSPEGLFFRDTRYLSRFEFRIAGRRPLLLGSVIQDDNAALTVDLTNTDAGSRTVCFRGTSLPSSGRNFSGTALSMSGSGCATTTRSAASFRSNCSSTRTFVTCLRCGMHRGAVSVLSKSLRPIRLITPIRG